MEPVLTNGTTTPTETQLRFHLEEYKAMRSEIAGFTKLGFDFYIYALIANGGIAAWLLTNKAQILAYGSFAMKIAAVIPLLVTGLAWHRSTMFAIIVRSIGRYLHKIEAQIAMAGMGWETFLIDPAERRLGSSLPGREAIGWALLAIADFAFVALI
jgi:hypothetical protein